MGSSGRKDPLSLLYFRRDKPLRGDRTYPKSHNLGWGPLTLPLALVGLPPAPCRASPDFERKGSGDSGTAGLPSPCPQEKLRLSKDGQAASSAAADGPPEP